MTNKTIEKLEGLLSKYLQLEKKLESPEIISDQKKSININIELSNISEIVSFYKKYKDCLNKKNEAYELLNSNDEEMKLLAKEEIKILHDELDQIEKDILVSLLPKDSNDDKNVIVEIRGAAGGDEANIFASDLFDMYYNYANLEGWKVEILNASKSLNGGFSQISFLIKGKQVYKKLKYESGIHRVQRVPVTESKGRIHTSTASVAVLPEVDDVVVKISPTDLRIDTYRASGAGGQHVNMTDSAVRITHIPTGVVVTSQDGRSQHDNKDKAMQVLKAKVYELELDKQYQETKNMRSLAVGSGKRAEKIRTYNFPQNRVSDHRISLTLNKLDQIMLGKLDDLINTLIAFDQQEQLETIN